MSATKDPNKNTHKMAHKESDELDRLWKSYVDSSGKGRRRRRWARSATIVVVLLLIVGALFVDDDIAWSAVRVVAEIFDHAANDIADALGVQRD